MIKNHIISVAILACISFFGCADKVELKIRNHSSLKPDFELQLDSPDLAEVNALLAEGKMSSLYSLHLLIDGKPYKQAVSGKYTLIDNKLIFSPYYPLSKGECYKMIYRQSEKVQEKKLCIDSDSKNDNLNTEIRFYPNTGSVPRNTLFFQIEFSEEMQNDIYAFNKVKIRDDQGNDIPNTWRHKSFWLNQGKVLVLMVHPGRVKRGIKMDIPFEIGKQYFLNLESGLKTIHGQSVKGQLSKGFWIKDNDYSSPEIHYDSFQLPSTGTKSNLEIVFSESIDYASIVDGVKIFGEDKQEIEGVFMVEKGHKKFLFHPADKWKKGNYTISFDKFISDFAGNRLNRPFEMKTVSEKEKDKTIFWSFKLD